jgi:hypothetical protein
MKYADWEDLYYAVFPTPFVRTSGWDNFLSKLFSCVRVSMRRQVTFLCKISDNVICVFQFHIEGGKIRG